MAKARKELMQNLKLVDAVVEVVDARIPLASRNPDIDLILQGMIRLVCLAKADLADPAITRQWVQWFAGAEMPAVPIDAQKGQGIKELLAGVERISHQRLAAWTARGRKPRAARLMVVGIPNVGKSSLINRLVGKSGARTGNLPGVTRGQQWLKLPGELELLDTPGVLWPKFADPEVGLKLAATGAIETRLFDLEAVVSRLLALLERLRPGVIQTRFGVDATLNAGDGMLLEEIGRRRGCLLAGGKVDRERAAGIVLTEYRSGKLGTFSLEQPESVPKAPHGL